MEHDDLDLRQLFDAMMQGQEIHDAGIISHDQSLKELEVHLDQQYFEKGFAAIPPEDMEAYIERANGDWPFNGEIATVSGRVEILCDEDDETIQAMFSHIAIADGEGQITRANPDDEELRYMVVDNAKLRSGGVVVDDMLDDDGRLSGVRVGYVFYHLSDGDEMIPLFAQPEMLDRHSYDTPTPAEARVRLEHKWPAQLEVIDTILTSGESLPVRLTSIATHLQQNLRDGTFRQLVELYVNEELELHMDTPYLAVVHSKIDSLGDIADENALWATLKIEGSLSIFLYAPEIRFSSVTENLDSAPEAYIFAKSLNDEFGDKPEMIGVAVDNIDRFISSRAATSLAARAIDALDRSIDEDMNTLTNLKNEVTYMPIEETDDIPEYVYRLEDIEGAFERISSLSDEYLMHTFTDKEAAEEDAEVLLQKIKEYLNGTGFFTEKHLVNVMGETVKTANLRYNLHWDPSQNALLHGTNENSPTQTLQFGDRVVGRTDQLYAAVESTYISANDDDDTEGTTFYTPKVVMGVVIARGIGMTVNSRPVLSQLAVINQASVPLDSSTEIKFTVLEQYRNVQATLDRARRTYGENSPIMNRMREINDALNYENLDDFTPLDPEILSRFSVDLGRVVRRHKLSTEPAAEVLDAMFSDRTVIVSSNVYTRDESGQYILDDTLSGSTLGWKIIDIQPQYDGKEVMLFAMSQDDETYRYLAMSSIKEFQY